MLLRGVASSKFRGNVDGEKASKCWPMVSLWDGVVFYLAKVALGLVCKVMEEQVGRVQ